MLAVCATTRRQRDLFEFIRSEAEHGRCPSFREMAQAIGLASVSNVAVLVDALVERGLIERLSNRARSIRVVETPAPFPALEPKRSRAVKVLPLTAYPTDELVAVLTRRGFRFYGRSVDMAA